MSSAISPLNRYEDRLPIMVYLVSPNDNLRKEFEARLTAPRWNMLQAGSGAGALELLRRHDGVSGLLLLDPMLPDLEVNDFNALVRSRFPEIQVLTLNSATGQILVGSSSPTPNAASLVDIINGAGALRTAANFQPVLVETPPILHQDDEIRLRGMIGKSQSMQRTFGFARMVAARSTTVLVTGESGTGKDLLAQEIHLISARRNQPLIVVNCSAIPEALLEAELFGYTKGSFTGAVQSRVGRIHAAHGGTLFLDEIGDMPLSLQSKILRFLEQGEVQRLGGNENLKVDVRVVAATNANLKKMVSHQQFREDLYYRLAVFPIHIPPLRERMDDLQELAHSFIGRFLPGASISAEAMSILAQHRWPGNVRELRNAIERATILVGSGREIKPEHIIL